MICKGPSIPINSGRSSDHFHYYSIILSTNWTSLLLLIQVIMVTFNLLSFKESFRGSGQGYANNEPSRLGSMSSSILGSTDQLTRLNMKALRESSFSFLVLTNARCVKLWTLLAAYCWPNKVQIVEKLPTKLGGKVLNHVNVSPFRDKEVLHHTGLLAV